MKWLRAYKTLALVLSPLFFSPITSHAVSLENSKIRIQIDDKGRITELTNTLWPDMNLIGTPGDGFWRLNLQKDRSLENIVGRKTKPTEFERPTRRSSSQLIP